MRVEPSPDQSEGKPDVFSRGRSPFPTILITLFALVVGGCLTLLIVSRLLQNQLAIYSSAESMDAASAILDFMDDLLPFYFLCALLLLLLLLVFFTVWIWSKTQSRLLRAGTILLFLLALALVAAFWLVGATSGPIPVPQLLPTATAPPG
jgi:hypothetical protein